MSLGGLIFFVLLLGGVTLLVSGPLLRRDISLGVDIRLERQRDRLLIYYERVLSNLRDLDEDHSTGKIADADYATEREIWMLRGVEALKSMDNLALETAEVIPEGDDATIDETIDAAIESAVASYRSNQT